jgi:hypothetical protein
MFLLTQFLSLRYVLSCNFRIYGVEPDIVPEFWFVAPKIVIFKLKHEFDVHCLFNTLRLQNQLCYYYYYYFGGLRKRSNRDFLFWVKKGKSGQRE